MKVNNLQDVAAERGVLSGIFNYGSDGYAEVSDILKTESFSLDSNQILFSCLKQILENESKITKIDYPSVLSAAKTQGFYDFLTRPDEQKHLRSIMQMPIEKESIRRFAGTVKKLEIAREYLGVLELAKSNILEVTGNESIEQIISKAEGPVTEYTVLLSGAGSQNVTLMGEGAEAYYQHLIDNPRDNIGIPTPFKRYNRAIGGGLRPGGLDLIGARQKTGKTFLVDNIGLFIAQNSKIPVLNIDTEMTLQEHQIRVGACMSGIDSLDIERGKLDSVKKQKILEAGRKLAKLPYYYDCVIGLSFEEILARMRRWVLKTVGINNETGKANPCVIIYDYIKMMNAEEINKNMAEHQMLGFITSSLKNFMGKYGVAGLCFAQLNRDGVDSEDSRTIRGSDRILDTVTSFSIYKYKTDEERAEEIGENSKYTHKLLTASGIARFGPGMKDGDYINMHADYAKSKITEGPTKIELLMNPSALQNNNGIIVDDTSKQPSINL